MKYLTGLFFSLLFISNTYATGAVFLCDASCDLLITFPNGGSIEAVEGLNITFGNGGELNLGEAGTVNRYPQPINLDFLTGGNLSLVLGESITFGDNGFITLGEGGNIEYSKMCIVSTGGVVIKAVWGYRHDHHC